MKIRTLQNFNVLVKLTIALAVILPVAGCYEFYMEREGEMAVNSFLAEMSPELAKKIANIEKEISLTEEKINKLSKLKLKHPNYADKIETSRRQWKVLRNKLIRSLKEIREVVESSYVTYELDKIQGGNQFNKISAQLLTSADSVLNTASITKNAIEQALDEVETQPLPSLDDDVSRRTSTLPNPIEPYQTPELFETVKETPPTVEVLEKPPVELKPDFEPKPLSPPNPTSICDAKNALAAIRLNLTMMVISMERTEQYALEQEIDKASRNLERAIAALLNNEYQTNGGKITTLQNIWATFKNTCQTEIIPAIRAGNNDKASEIAAIQAEQMNTMNDIIQALNGDSCD